MTDRRRYHQLVFIWVRDPAMFATYLRDLPPIVARYGGAADLSLHPTAVRADQLALPALPDIVNLVHYQDKQAYERFGADPEFRKIEPLRARSVDLMTFEGYLRMADPPPAGPSGRVYNVELVTHRDGSGESLMDRYGYRVEYVLVPETGPADQVRPDLIKISSLPNQAARDEIEQELYSVAADHIVWLTGQAIG